MANDCWITKYWQWGANFVPQETQFSQVDPPGKLRDLLLIFPVGILLCYVTMKQNIPDNNMKNETSSQVQELKGKHNNSTRI
jgi:hypothetical protein